MEIGLAKMKTDGSVTIPWGIRKYFRKGEQLVVLAEGNRVVLKRASEVQKSLLTMARDPSTKGPIRPAAKPPVKMPRRGPGGRFLPAKASSHSVVRKH